MMCSVSCPAFVSGVFIDRLEHRIHSADRFPSSALPRTRGKIVCASPFPRRLCFLARPFGWLRHLDFRGVISFAPFAFASSAVSVTPLHQHEATLHFGYHARLELVERVLDAAMPVCQEDVSVG